MSAATSLMNKVLQRARYSVSEMGSVVTYTVSLPAGTIKVRLLYLIHS